MECKIRHDNANYKMPIEYEKDPGLFSLKIYHAGKFKYVDDMGLRALGNDLVVRRLGSTVVIEEMPSSTPVAKPTKTKRLLLEYTPTVNVEDQVVANENANETVDGIMQEFVTFPYFQCLMLRKDIGTEEDEMMMNYLFD
ncbi:hypothetical protein Tco_0561838 [Tanacetum coccineum]